MSFLVKLLFTDFIFGPLLTNERTELMLLIYVLFHTLYLVSEPLSSVSVKQFTDIKSVQCVNVVKLLYKHYMRRLMALFTFVQTARADLSTAQRLSTEGSTNLCSENVPLHCC